MDHAGRVAEAADETWGDDHVVGGQFVDGGLAQAEPGGIDAAAENVEDVLHAGLAVGGQAPQVGAADHHGAGPERDGLDDVAAPADAAVKDDLNVVADR